MRIGVIGTGYVGLVSGACFAKMGHDVLCVDVDENKINLLKNGEIPIYEPNLKEIVDECYKNKTLNFTTDIKEALNHSKALFIAVGTPMGGDGRADLKYVLAVAKSIGENLENEIIVIDKSTVPVGTADKVKEIIKIELKKRGKDIKFDVVSNPEFLKEGAAVEDFLKPDRVVIGCESDFAYDIMKEIYHPFMMSRERIIKMDIKSAEMTKYAANSMLATKISFINEIAMICERVGADINMVRAGIGSDSRIGYSFIYAGCGYGGSCFPKDVEALIYTAKEHGFDPLLLSAVEKRNYEQKLVLFQKLKSYFKGDLKDKTIAVWGLSFKPNTDDMREASSIVLINALNDAGAIIKTYDPKAYKEAKIYFKDIKNITYENDKYDATNNADALVLVTEWNEFRILDFDRLNLKNKVIFDGRNQFNKDTMKKNGFDYFQIGVKDEKISYDTNDWK